MWLWSYYLGAKWSGQHWPYGRLGDARNAFWFLYGQRTRRAFCKLSSYIASLEGLFRSSPVLQMMYVKILLQVSYYLLNEIGNQFRDKFESRFSILKTFRRKTFAHNNYCDVEFLVQSFSKWISLICKGSKKLCLRTKYRLSLPYLRNLWKTFCQSFRKHHKYLCTLGLCPFCQVLE